MVLTKSYDEELVLENELAKSVPDIKEVQDGSIMARMTLLRHLRSQNYNVKKAEVGLRKYCEFKNEKNLNGIGAKAMDKATRELFPINIICKDSEGRPVIYTAMRKWKIDEIMKLSNWSDFVVITMFHSFEQGLHGLVEYNEKLPVGKRLVTDFILISDYQDIGLTSFANINLLKIFGQLSIANGYFVDVPIAYHINAPVLLSPIKNFCTGDPTKNHFFGKQTAWEKGLKKVLDFKNLEPILGKSILPN